MSILPNRYYVAEVYGESKVQRLYFHSHVQGLTGPQHGSSEDDTWTGRPYA